MRLKLINGFYFFLTLCLTTSCSEDKTGYISNTSPTIIYLDSITKQYSLSNYIDSLTTINLDTAKEALISEAFSIGKVIFNDNKYFILDSKYMSIKVFDSTGHYLYNIGKLGKGRGEFIRLEDIVYYPYHNSLMVLCNNPSKLAEFTLDGKIIKDQLLNFWATGVSFPSNNSRIFYVNQNESELSKGKNILLTDSSNNLNARLFDQPKNISATIKFSGGLYYTNLKETYFNPAFSNIWYLLRSDTAIPAFETNFGKKSIPAGIEQSKLLKELNNFNYPLASFLQNGTYLALNYSSNNNSVAAFYNPSSKKIITSEPALDSLNMLFDNTMFEYRGKYIMPIDLKRVYDFIKKNAIAVRNKFPDLYLSLTSRKNKPGSIALLIFKVRAVE